MAPRILELGTRWM